MRGGAETVSGVGSGATLSSQGVVTAWSPTSSDDTLGGPGSVNPLLTSAGECGVEPEWPAEFGGGKSGVEILGASNVIGAQQVRRVGDMGAMAGGGAAAAVRSVTLNFSAASGADVELLRRMLVTTRCGSAVTRFRVPGQDSAAGGVPTASRYRWAFQAGSRVRIARSPDGMTARVEGITLERVE